MSTVTRAGLVGLGATIAMACGGSSSSNPAAAPPPSSQPRFAITISNLSFSPLNLRAPPGATITVVNADGMLHSVTSEVAPNAFRPAAASGVAFDTGAFTGTRTFTLPANAPNGAALPYYCSVHLATMNTPNGTITVDSSIQGAAPAPAAPSAPTGPSSPGY